MFGRNELSLAVMRLLLRIIQKKPDVEEIEFLLPGNLSVVVAVPRVK